MTRQDDSGTSVGAHDLRCPQPVASRRHPDRLVPPPRQATAPALATVGLFAEGRRKQARWTAEAPASPSVVVCILLRLTLFPSGSLDVRYRPSLTRLGRRHRRRCHGLLDPLPPRRGGRRRRHPAGAQPADLRHHLALRRPGAGASLDPESHRPHPLLRLALRKAGGGDRPGDRLDQQGLALDRHQRRPARSHQAPGGAGAPVRRARPVRFGGGGEGALAADERRRRHRRGLGLPTTAASARPTCVPRSSREPARGRRGSSRTRVSPASSPGTAESPASRRTRGWSDATPSHSAPVCGAAPSPPWPAPRRRCGRASTSTCLPSRSRASRATFRHCPITTAISTFATTRAGCSSAASSRTPGPSIPTVSARTSPSSCCRRTGTTSSR